MLMAIKLARLPDRTPVKLSITVMPALADDLAAYAKLYQESYGREEAIAELVPAMLSAFLETDRTFSRGRRPSG
jgi:hypothetical protein